MSVAVTLIISFFLRVVSAKRCKNKWSFSPHSGNCYYIVDEPIGWNVAEVDCQWKMAHVMSIHSEAENKFVAALAMKVGKPIWIGAALFGNSHIYENADLSNFDYTNWINGTQPEYNKGKKCIKMHPSNGTWFTDCCFKRPVPYLCQKPAGHFESSELNITADMKPQKPSTTSDMTAENVTSMLRKRMKNLHTAQIAAKSRKTIKAAKSIDTSLKQERLKFADPTIDSQKRDAAMRREQIMKQGEQKLAAGVNWQKSALIAARYLLGTGRQNENQFETTEANVERKQRQMSVIRNFIANRRMRKL